MVMVYGLCSSTPRGDGNPRTDLASTQAPLQGLCSSTPRGDGNYMRNDCTGKPYTSGLCSSTPRGDGNFVPVVADPQVWWKAVYAAQPREGTETCTTTDTIVFYSLPWFMQLNPARGRKHFITNTSFLLEADLVYAAQPREGTETNTI